MLPLIAWERRRHGRDVRFRCRDRQGKAPTTRSHWSEEQAERALRAAESDGAVDEWGDLSKVHEVNTADTLQRLAKEEQAAGQKPWPLPVRLRPQKRFPWLRGIGIDSKVLESLGLQLGGGGELLVGGVADRGPESGDRSRPAGRPDVAD